VLIYNVRVDDSFLGTQEMSYFFLSKIDVYFILVEVIVEKISDLREILFLHFPESGDENILLNLCRFDDFTHVHVGR
jgi:hypothetical protein